ISSNFNGNRTGELAGKWQQSIPSTCARQRGISMNADKHASGRIKSARRATSAGRTNGENAATPPVDALVKKRVRGADRTRVNKLATIRIEALLNKGQWRRAEAVIRKQLQDNPEDHWLWARLAGAKYEQREYRGALDAAEKALEIVPDCPLALWS